ncbi:MAG: 16S rRNA (cytosine(1402)-N(4))-methyltransferase RsmH [Candidatus Omnitrophota bacterium]|nr:16S rRNA (cytosine(1402)-N(4))-methyltransferase RsmH [Candidatus Omnitrophota bacterium]MBU1929533.1 16S rRNA (cytosine(1402)-N(4))-methyltransferase RsmH [Candidatus Omnitrophota bacterium]MBU2035820.1 16S rRNA (cytosine(1402)-N(4))-methyltransferase RsmH [Candidatus Omnitrophota bacterium]MBU2221388.1 16S rRNA (cytosine(1402)-N(4))-methyltransferase RsmH [Candidatus Omnitrophota bacterium]MBU2258716.1 16S rRNA (cytosine(1402)-N(4))-methyltransferase RsmH [Candidatus Omnitrophota bacterium
MELKFHIPVMLNEAVDHLNLKPGKIIIDATIGTGGHSEEIIKKISPGGRLIGIDRDEESLNIAKERLSDYQQSCEFVYGNFSDIDSILKKLEINKVDGILLDLGISSYQLANAQRGFSFQSEGPLDMRLDRNSYISAYDLVNNLNEDEISSLLWTFGQERWHNRIARHLVTERQRHAISTTTDLSDIIIKAVPYKYRYYRIHPATRTFQAVRIAVNRELEALEIALDKAMGLLESDARMCVISFHSLEDRIAKLSFRKFASSGLAEIITKKPLEPTSEEAAANPRSRSAKLRVCRRI